MTMLSAEPNPYLLISDVDDTLLGNRRSTERFGEWYASVGDRLTLVYASGRFARSVAGSIRKTALPEPQAIVGGVGSEICMLPGLRAVEDWERRISCRWNADRVREVLGIEDDLRPQSREAQSQFKVSYFIESAPPHRLEKIRSILRNEGLEVSMLYSSDRDLDILPAGADKGSAARFLADAWGFDDDHVIVAGNSANDTALYRHGFRGVVVANAHQTLKQLPRSVAYLGQKSFADGVREGVLYWTGWPQDETEGVRTSTNQT